MKNLTCLIIVLTSLHYFSFAQAQKIVIIRHAEKPDNGENLSCKGLNRALKLSSVLEKKFGIFNSILVPSLNQGKNTSHARMYQTIVPYAVKHNLEINSKYDESDIKGIASGAIKKSGIILLVWEHKKIPAIVKALGITNSQEDWNDNDFDSIWIISYVNGKATLSKDKENIIPVSVCE